MCVEGEYLSEGKFIGVYLKAYVHSQYVTVQLTPMKCECFDFNTSFYVAIYFLLCSWLAVQG